MRILYVEDERADSLMFARLVIVAGKSRGYEMEVDCVSKIKDIGAGPLYDCILLDLSLANGGTADSLEWIRSNHDRMPPIVVLSGHPENDSECIRSGAEDFLYKPDSHKHPELFVDRIKLAIVRHRARRLRI